VVMPCSSPAACHRRTTGIKVFEIIPPAVDTELGSDRREDKTQSHGGMPVREFIEQAMHALETDNLEAAIGSANHSREKREALFGAMNSRWD
ncbi:MAG: short-chain dehydrogenase, partial [Flavisolibacter sp.]|nr:short-chain dehydrogenase [Flavisolibacter sp.]